MRRTAALSLLLLPVLAVAAGTGGWVRLPGGSFRSTLKYEDRSLVRIKPFQPVSYTHLDVYKRQCKQ